jgi:hypothetical protein
MIAWWEPMSMSDKTWQNTSATPKTHSFCFSCCRQDTQLFISSSVYLYVHEWMISDLMRNGPTSNNGRGWMNRVLAAVSRPRAGWTRQLAGCLDAHSSRFWIRIPARCRLALGCLPVRSCHSFPWASPPPPGPGGTIRTPTSLARAVRTAFPKNNKGNNKHCDVSQETLRTSTWVRWIILVRTTVVAVAWTLTWRMNGTVKGKWWDYTAPYRRRISTCIQTPPYPTGAPTARDIARSVGRSPVHCLPDQRTHLKYKMFFSIGHFRNPFIFLYSYIVYQYRII